MSLEFCPVCNKKIQQKEDFCKQCGSDLNCYLILENEKESLPITSSLKKKKSFFPILFAFNLIFLTSSILFLNFKKAEFVNKFLLGFEQSLKTNSLKFATSNKTQIITNKNLTTNSFDDSVVVSKLVSNNKISKDTLDFSMKKYQKALNLSFQKKYNESILMFSEILETNYPPIYKKNLLYWIGNSYFCLDQKEKALLYFEKSLQCNGYINKTSDAYFMIGKIKFGFSQFEESENSFRKSLETNPQNIYREKIKGYLNEINER